MKKPSTAPIRDERRRDDEVSPTWKPTYAIATIIISTHIDARPLKPSMMLTALATPVTASTVSSMAKGVNTIRLVDARDRSAVDDGIEQDDRQAGRDGGEEEPPTRRDALCQIFSQAEGEGRQAARSVIARSTDASLCPVMVAATRPRRTRRKRRCRRSGAPDACGIFAGPRRRCPPTGPHVCQPTG